MNTKGFFNFLFLILIAAAIVIIMSGNAGKTLSAFSSDTVAFSYTHKYNSDPLFIGDKQFNPAILSYSCGDIGKTYVRYPDPNPDCWTTSVSYDGNEHKFTGGKTTKLNSYLSATLQPYGKITFDEDVQGDYASNSDWRSTYAFILKPSGILSSKIDDDRYYFKLNSDAQVLVEIDNELASFSDLQSGLWQRISHSLLTVGTEWETVPFALRKGTNKYLVPIDTSELGKATIEIQPFAKIIADQTVTVRQAEPVRFNYEIVMQLPDDGQGNPRENLTLWEKFKNWFFGLFGGVR